MEGIPRVLMLVPDIKLPEGPNFIDQAHRIKNYIAQHYQNNPENFNEAVNELDALRNCVLLGYDEQRTILVLKRYFAQLMMMKNRFPMELDGEASIEFSWQDKCSNNLPVVLSDISFEICCVMFNIGTLHAQIAGSQLRTEVDTIKVAFDHFRAASWPFIYLRDELKASRLGIVDFSSDALTFYANVMLAQAHECLLEKSLIGHSMALVSAKLALRISDIYSSCAHVIQGDASADKDLALIKISSSRSKQWLSLCNVKTNLYAAICAFFRGNHFDEEKQYGKGVSCYAYGLERSKQALAFAEKDKRDGLIQAAVFVLEIMTQKEANSRKENDFIYHERTPAYADVGEFKTSHELVSPTSYDPLDKSLAGEDLFKQLLPTTVITILSMYEERKAQLKRDVQKKIEGKDSELEEFLTTLRMDRLNLDQPYESYRLPDALLTYCNEMASNPSAIPDVNLKFHEVATKSAEAECKLAELTNRLNTITAKELTDTDGYKAIVKKVKNLSEHQSVAKKNNQELQTGFDATTDNLKLLTKPINELTNMLCDEFFDPVDTPEGKELKRMLDKVDEMQKQRRKLTEDLKDALNRDDITPQALIDPYVQPEVLIEKQIKKHDQKVELINQNMTAQPVIMKAVVHANAAFDEIGQKIAKREEKKSTESVKLLAAYESYKEIVKQTNAAIEFYSQLFVIIQKLSDSIKNIEDANTRFHKEAMDRKKAAEERERQAVAAKQAADAMAEFGFAAPGPVKPVAGGKIEPEGPRGRKTLEDYLNHFSGMAGLPPKQPQAPYSQFPSSPYAVPFSAAPAAPHNPSAVGPYNPPSGTPMAPYHAAPVASYNALAPHGAPSISPYGNLPAAPLSSSSATPYGTSSASVPFNSLTGAPYNLMPASPYSKPSSVPQNPSSGAPLGAPYSSQSASPYGANPSVPYNPAATYSRPSVAAYNGTSVNSYVPSSVGTNGAPFNTSSAAPSGAPYNVLPSATSYNGPPAGTNGVPSSTPRNAPSPYNGPIAPSPALSFSAPSAPHNLPSSSTATQFMPQASMPYNPLPNAQFPRPGASPLNGSSASPWHQGLSSYSQPFQPQNPGNPKNSLI
ncbi:unnamed protein product [Bursaphelenchus okinawaensis]|uniref:BRO1 domain-containing protein n=1 Tax=Bursaphelenchus okinawaensis TaxID=465554 RepID=A0A811JSC7_9BILA|nr:unnamed protein product [Bursaphelenchus okinawaensis]CAG9081396.1 unnamed protein product [Bursaphelenchus okinawaensis]